MFFSVVAYKISDLMFSVKIEEMSKKSSKKFLKATSLGELSSLGVESLVVCDLVVVKAELPTIKAVALQKGFKILGYYPHVDKETEKFARSTKIDYLTPRSAFQPKFNMLLTK